MERLRRLRRVSARGVGRLYQSSIRPALTHGSEVHGLSPNENRRVERIATAALAPASGGVSRTAKLTWHGEPLHRELTAATRQLCSELWASTQGDAAALPVSGPASLLTGWADALRFEGGWRDAVGPIHIAVLEARRAGFDAIAGFALRRGGVTLQLIRDSAALVCHHLHMGLRRTRQEALADLLYGQSSPAAGFAALPGPKSKQAHRGFATALACDALWTRSRLQSCGYRHSLSAL